MIENILKTAGFGGRVKLKKKSLDTAMVERPLFWQ
jgi:hypothetical protein